MSSPRISELALEAHTARELRRTAATEEKAAEQRVLQERLMTLMRSSWNSEAGIVLFEANTDPRTQNLTWRSLDDENGDWELFTAGAGIHVRQISAGKPSRGYHFGSDLGDGAVLVIRLSIPDLQHRGDFFVQVNGGPILPARDLATIGEAIRAARS